MTDVLIVHPIPLFRAGLTATLASMAGWSVVGEAEHGAQAIRRTFSVHVDLTVMATDLPGVTGLDIARVLTRHHPQMAVVLLGPLPHGPLLVKALRAGVAAWLPPTVACAELIDTLRHVRRGAHPIDRLVMSSPTRMAAVLAAFRRMVMVTPPLLPDGSPLSIRDRTILSLMAAGYSRRALATRFAVAPTTITRWVASICRTLDVAHPMHAVVRAVRCGWITGDLPDPAIPTGRPGGTSPITRSTPHDRACDRVPDGPTSPDASRIPSARRDRLVTPSSQRGIPQHRTDTDDGCS